MPGLDPRVHLLTTFRVPDAVQRERSEAVRRCSGTVAKVVCVTIPGLLRTTRLRLALRCARDTPPYLSAYGLKPPGPRAARAQ